MSKLLTDIRGITIQKEDTVAVTYYDYDKSKPSLDINTVVDVSMLRNSITLSDGEDVSLDKYDVLVVPSYYKV